MSDIPDGRSGVVAELRKASRNLTLRAAYVRAAMDD